MAITECEQFLYFSVIAVKTPKTMTPNIICEFLEEWLQLSPEQQVTSHSVTPYFFLNVSQNTAPFEQSAAVSQLFATTCFPFPSKVALMQRS